MVMIGLQGYPGSMNGEGCYLDPSERHPGEPEPLAYAGS
jgi:hypothetical protein